MTRRANPEEQFQKSVAQLLDSLGWLWWHTPLGELRPKKTVTRKGRRVTYSPAGKKLKDMGAKNGVSDVFILEPWEWTDRSGIRSEKNLKIGGWIKKHRFHDAGRAVCIELKIRPNKPMKAQLEFLTAARAHGALTAVCYDMDEVLAVCRMVRPLNGRSLT